MLASDLLWLSGRDNSALSMFSLTTCSGKVTGRHPAWLAQMWLLTVQNSSQPTNLECFILQAFSSGALSARSIPTPCQPIFTKLSQTPLCLCSVKLEETTRQIQVTGEETNNSIQAPLFLLETKLKICCREHSLQLNSVCVKHAKHPAITGGALPACSSPVV